MKLLILTQVIDRTDPGLGFFHEWIVGLAGRFDQVEVVCLYEGVHELPPNVRVHSLGKESLPGTLGTFSRVVYIVRFYGLAWRLRKDYDAVFVHMNQEYVLLGGPVWKLLGKRIYLWRNHYAGSVLTDIAASFCTNVFCTSRHSFTAKYTKTIIMPVGIDTTLFYPDSSVARKEHSILFLARMAPSKNPLLLIEALRELNEAGIRFTASFVGSPSPEHEAYYRSLAGRVEHYGLGKCVSFLPGVSKHESPELFRAHQIFVNCSPSGMLDKTIFEAAASGCLVLAASADYADTAGPRYTFGKAAELADRLKEVFEASPEARAREQEAMGALAQMHALPVLIDELAAQLGKP